jgi:8-oxo-dGTP diphosphatase
MLVVAVALVGVDGSVLMQRRRLGRAHGGLWEFPGGKIEPGEIAEEAAVREIAEELGLAIRASSLRPVGFASDPGVAGKPSPLILLFRCDDWAGEPQCLDAEEIAWVAPQALAGLAMPPLDYPLARALLRMAPEA